ncbi:TPA: hypothetical protein ACPTWU_004426, partial [Escherichia coli]
SLLTFGSLIQKHRLSAVFFFILPGSPPGGYIGGRLENGIYGHSRFCNTDFDDKLACLNLSGV